MERILILGAGYAGIQAVRSAARTSEDREILLVDQNGYHQLVTEMYRVVGGAVDPTRLILPVERLIDTRRVRFRKETVCSIHPDRREVQTNRSTLPYDALLVALGSEPEFYDVPGAARYAFTLQYLDSARRLRRRLLELAEGSADRRTLRVVIVGGGLTGIELIAELAEFFRRRWGRHPKAAMVLLQAAPRILPEEPDDLVRYAEEVLHGFDVDIRVDEPVKEVRHGMVLLADGTALPADLTVWTGGVRANPIPGRAGLPTDGRGRVLVSGTLSVPGFDAVFAAGDVALARDPSSGRPLPPTAQLAMQQGRVAGVNAAVIHTGRGLETFVPKPLGMVASLGRSRGIADFDRFRLRGRAALAAKKLALWRYLLTVEGWTMGFSETPLSWWHAHPRVVGGKDRAKPHVPG